MADGTVPDATWAWPPHALMPLLLRHVLNAELRWQGVVRDLRLVCQGWREAVDGHLPLLLPRAHDACALSATVWRRRFTGLRVLHAQLGERSRMGEPSPLG